jgi:hypothetical protein
MLKSIDNRKVIKTSNFDKTNNINKPRKNIIKNVLIVVGIAAAVVAVFAVGVFLYKFGAQMPIDKISVLLRNCNTRLNNFGRIDFNTASHISLMPVNGHGGTYNGRIWQMDMNYVPKRSNDAVEPMTQRELIKLDLDLVKSDKGDVMPRRNRRRVVKVYEKLLKKDKVSIPFNLKINGESEPDFSGVCFEVIKIKVHSGRYNRRGKKGNMTLASKKCSKKWHLLQRDFDDWKDKAMQLVWHEAKNGKLYLVPHNIHANIQHEGLISQQKKLNK